MVKRKGLPVKGEKAGYAARTEQRVQDRTLDNSTGSTTESDSEDNEVLEKQKKEQKSNKLSVMSSSKNITKSKSSKKKSRVLREIVNLQKTTKLLIPRAPFLRLIKELIQDRGGVGIRITEMAVEALREASECVLTSIFEDSYLLALHAKRITLFPRDMNLLLRLKHDAFLTQNI